MDDLIKISIFCTGLWWAYSSRKEEYWFVSVAALIILTYMLWGQPWVSPS